MSHFTVTVRLTEARLTAHNGDYNAALTEILAPYQENNMGDCPKQYLEFRDTEDEYRQEYETATDTWVDLGPANNAALSGEITHSVDHVVSAGDRIHRGRCLVRSWHPMFAGNCPDTYLRVEIPYKDLYATFDSFVADYHGIKRDDEKQRYGYWENPNKKWDWWTVGGRWRGFYPVKPGTVIVIGKAGVFDNPSDGGSDVVRVGDIDFDTVAIRQSERFATFKREYRELLAGRKFDAFEGPRSQAMDIGLLRVEQDSTTALRPGETQIGPFWGEAHQHIAGTAWHEWRDIGLDLGDFEFERYRNAFNPLKTFAALDDSGWYAPGNMGWWASTDHTPETYMTYADGLFSKIIQAAAPNDLLVVVDCHI